MASVNLLNQVLPIIKNNTKEPEKFLSVQSDVAKKFRECTKLLYDHMKTESDHKNNALPELIIKGFDEEQIWQQLEIQNENELVHFTTEISRILAGNNKISMPISLTNPEKDNTQVDNKNDSINDNKDDNMLDANMSDSDDEMDVDIDVDGNLNNEKKVQSQKRFKNASIVDDKFFKLKELDNYLNNEDKKELKKDNNNSDEDSDNESVDLFEDHSENGDESDAEDGKMLKYADFFDAPESGSPKQAEAESDEKQEQFNSENDSNNSDSNNDDEMHEDNNKPTNKSSLESRQERLQNRIEQFESEAISEKPWQLKGEVRAPNRPINSLLEEYVEFDITSRPAPVITEKTTLKLEDIIRQRIKDNAWDDPIRKFKPVETPLEYKKKLVMDQEKSKKSLTQIYEDAFMKQKDSLNQDDQEREEEEPQAHKEIRELMHSLFRKLDALSNYHFTPKPAQPELKIISNIPAINMEEVAPVATTNATLLAPEEVKAKARGDVAGKSERTQTDMKRERRMKKIHQREKEKAKNIKEKTLIEKLKPKNNKQSKNIQDAMVKKLTKDRNISEIEKASHKVPKTSTAFFTQLQDEVTSHIKSKTDRSNKKKDKIIHSAIKLKL
ncbi:hypothetical protein PV325_003084 [Microctonus aethiopoides]|uniref:U3 small nucleolar ribonucleoprotein protein MPP10 n=1 Tax=Microctonus aethiopoides TaxID=144406 RepID=A0AA39FQA1_9HYME|nr:hypothetical protein PV325_003084 [Microctonus aethiopoides]KAK0095708.1 hypothetical protein PV326_007615 [Microctonus aethiopoides]KAK0173668.1 hypothetical protein PV328_006830 [Microctonus aethiopoides]